MPLSEGLLLSLDPAPAAGGGFSAQIMMMLAFVAIFYFVMLRPQQKEAKAHAELLASIQKGDKVVTAAGVHGRVHEVKADTLVLEINVNPQVFMTVDRDSVKRKVEPPKADTTKPEPTKGA